MENYSYYSAKSMSMKWLVLGLILILIGYYLPNWNIGIVIGVYLILKAVWITLVPVFPYRNPEEKRTKPKRR
jgi:hypothetical protein